MERYSPAELTAAAGVSHHALDYWQKVGLLIPSLPGGYYTSREMSLGLVLGEAARHGTPGPILAALVERLEGEPMSWPEHLWLTSHGVVLDEDLAPCAWVIHPRRVLANSGPQMLLALAS